MSTQPGPIAIADDLDRMYDQLDPVDDWRPAISAAGNELRRQHAEIERLQAKLQLARDAYEAEHAFGESWHADAMGAIAERDALRVEIEQLTKANEGQTRMNVTLVMENSELIRERDALRAQQPPAQPVKRLTDEQIRDVLLSASRDAAVKLGVPADELGEPDEESLRSATMVARWVEPAMAAAWGVKLEG